MLTNDAIITVDIEKPAAGGRMIARHEGQVVLVQQAIPGERMRVRITRVRPGVAYADPVEVVEASPDRRAVQGDWMCGGCAYAHIAAARQPALKAEILRDALARIGGLTVPGPVPVAAGAGDGYRMRARLHVRRGRIGFFREGTHELCDPAVTRQLLPETLATLGRMEPALHRARADGVTDLDLVENVQATERVVHLVLAPGAAPPRPGPLAAIAGATGISCSAPRGPEAFSLGHPYVVDEVAVAGAAGGPVIRLRHHVESFFQANRYLLATLVARVTGQVPAGRVLDLYAGVGPFAIALAALGDREVVAVEGDRRGATDLAMNAIPYGAAVRAVHLPVERFLEGRSDPDATLIVDPPRTGLSPEALAEIVATGARRVVYVSCDVATLARDVRAFVAGGYGPTHVEAFDLFPNTAHVEGLVVLQRD
ncbi:MAG TPA: TRAM domain-containing protein [Vicinamibacterales bacterium]|nr:TRAM domain-containing protein [Vicinamibacterales bacterium]